MNDDYVKTILWDNRNYGGELTVGETYYKGQFVTYNGRLFHITAGFTCTLSELPDVDSTLLYVRTWKGAWSASTTYSKFDAVSYNGSSFYSLIEDNLNHTPPSTATSNTYWGCYAAKGDKGDTGDQGDPGGDANHWALQEDPSGTKDGVNQTFTLAHTPTGTVNVFYGSGLGLAFMVYNVDYSCSGTTLTLITFAPNAANGDYIRVMYPYA